MIAWLRGEVRGRSVGNVVVDVGGVGYLVSVTAQTAQALPAGEAVELHISTIVREDAFLLYGFPEEVDRDAFELLREVNGVGPKHALAVLDTLSVDELRAAIASEDLKALTKVSGVGRKLAARLCLELKTKLPARFEALGLAAQAAASGGPLRRATPDPLQLALAQLDYKKSEIDLALTAEAVPAEGEAPLDQRLAAALRVLARQL